MLVECTLKCLIKANKSTKWSGLRPFHSSHPVKQEYGNVTQNTDLGRQSLPVKLRHGGTEFSIYLFISPFWPLEIGKTVTASHQDIKPALSQHKYEKAKTSPKPKNKVKKQKQKTPLCRSPLVPTAFWTSLQDVPGGEPSKAGCLASSHLLQVPSCPTAWHLPLTLFLARLHLKAIKSPSPSVRDKVQMPPKPPAHG